MNSQSDQVKGHATVVAGIVTGNKDLQDKGDAQVREADAAAHVDDAKAKVADAIDTVKDKLDDAADKATDALHSS